MKTIREILIESGKIQDVFSVVGDVYAIRDDAQTTESGERQPLTMADIRHTICQWLQYIDMDFETCHITPRMIQSNATGLTLLSDWMKNNLKQLQKDYRKRYVRKSPVENIRKKIQAYKLILSTINYLLSTKEQYPEYAMPSDLDAVIETVIETECSDKAKQTEAGSIQEAFAIYTGGDIWLFYGSLTNGYYFITDDEGYTMFLDEEPDETCYVEWQTEHCIKELNAKENLRFCIQLLKKLSSYQDDVHRGGFTNTDMELYANDFLHLVSLGNITIEEVLKIYSQSDAKHVVLHNLYTQKERISDIDTILYDGETMGILPIVPEEVHYASNVLMVYYRDEDAVFI